MEDKFKVKQTGEINTFTVTVEKDKAVNPAGMEKNFNLIKALLNNKKESANPRAKYDSIEEFVANTDFKQLCDQKAIIVKATSDEPLTADEKAELEGMLSFLDAFQDFCTDTLGEDEKRIFPNMDNS